MKNIIKKFSLLFLVLIFSTVSLVGCGKTNDLVKKVYDYYEDSSLHLETTYAYDKEVLENGEEREVLHIHPALAPMKVTVLPLIKKLHSEKAMEIYSKLCSEFMVSYDEAGSIGKRYRRNDAIGTPFCITYDFDTENDNCVTVRDRDTMEQVRIKIDELDKYLEEYFK